MQVFKQLLCSLFLLLLTIGGYSQSGVIRCHTMENDAALRNNFPELGTLEDFEEWLAPKVQEYKESVQFRAVVTLPIVFHVIHDNDAVGSGDNISATYINAQVTQLNNDFRKIAGTSGDNSNPVGADTEIEFCPATVDPNGNAMAEPGINRINRNSLGWSAPPYGVCQGQSINTDYINNTIKPQSQWDPNNYINIWVMDLNCGLLGYAQFPSNSGLSGLNTNGGASSTDGVVILSSSTGSTSTPFPVSSPYNQGRTLTHELGHFFGLRHIWGDASCGTDYCADTPTQQTSSSGCPNTTTCDGQNDMVENYMDYSYDNCMNIFTADQKARIQAVMANSPRRGSLINSAACGTPNPPTCTDGIQNGNETGVDCGGPDCPACPVCSAITITINLDNYPEETSWSLTTDTGSPIASGGTYGSQPDGSTVVINECLIDGCYTFTINDSYGDGICCSYGNGSYSVTLNSDGSTLASGGSFGSSEATNFCISSGPVVSGCTDPSAHNYDPSATVDDGSCETCTDGVQNGDETDVDCGGALCAACPTCSDGIQNGNETGVDCGGPDCPACPVNCDTPSGLAASPAIVEASLTWNAASGATDYNVRARETGTSTWTTGNNLSAPVNYTGLTACTEYEFQVQSNCTGATSAWSSSFVFTTTGCTGGCTYSAINSNDFEGGWGIWNDGGSDARRSANDSPYANGTYCIRLRDNTSTSTMTTDNLDLSSYEELTVDFSCYPRSMENGEDLWLQVSTNGGSSYSTVATWASGTDFTNGTRFDPSVVITGTFTSTTRLRFRNDASGNSDWMYIDDVVITGCSSGGARIINESLTSEEVVQEAAFRDLEKELVADLNLFPNPTRDKLNVAFTVAETTEIQLIVTDFNGRTISMEQIDAQAGSYNTAIKTVNMVPGFYFVHLINKDQRISKKFVVIK